MNKLFTYLKVENTESPKGYCLLDIDKVLQNSAQLKKIF